MRREKLHVCAGSAADNNRQGSTARRHTVVVELADRVYQLSDDVVVDTGNRNHLARIRDIVAVFRNDWDAVCNGGELVGQSCVLAARRGSEVDTAVEQLRDYRPKGLRDFLVFI